MTRIDSHQHYWNPARGDYDWMPMDDATLAQPYGPSDLEPQLKAHGFDRTVLVQAAATVNETEYLLGIADATASVAGVVGWVDFESLSGRADLERLSGHPKFLGIRPMIQDIPDDDWMLRNDVQWGFRAVADLGLTFDALGFPRHLENFLTILRRYPDMRTVVDHCMKPRIRNHNTAEFDHWADGMRRIAEETGAYCKYSALVTEAKENWCPADLRPYVDHVFEVFGPDRILWGSDWPVCRLRTEYSGWVAAAERLVDGLSESETARVFGETAAEFYRLES
ncbi:MAG: amidohydrolase family protein [Paracoccaceae bacterium]|nr:amidohydrolase family protein [Paracoccaceae bacterium]